MINATVSMKRGEIHVTYELLAQLLKLSDDEQVIGIDHDCRRRVVRVQVAGAGELVLDGLEPPMIRRLVPVRPGIVTCFCGEQVSLDELVRHLGELQHHGAR